jgi:hypothetical protein
MMKLQSTLRGSISDRMVDHCTTNNIDLVDWHKWRLAIQREGDNVYRKINRLPKRQIKQIK